MEEEEEEDDPERAKIGPNWESCKLRSTSVSLPLGICVLTQSSAGCHRHFLDHEHLSGFSARVVLTHFCTFAIDIERALRAARRIPALRLRAYDKNLASSCYYVVRSTSSCGLWLENLLCLSQRRRGRNPLGAITYLRPPDLSLYIHAERFWETDLADATNVTNADMV